MFQCFITFRVSRRRRDMYCGAIEGELGVSARPTPYCNGPRHTRTQVRRFLTQILFTAQKCVDCNSSGDDDDDMATATVAATQLN